MVLQQSLLHGITFSGPRPEELHAKDLAAALFGGEENAAEHFTYDMGLGYPVELQISGNGPVAARFRLFVGEADGGEFRIEEDRHRLR